MVISGGGLKGQATPSLRGKEAAATSKGATCEPSVLELGGEKFVTPAEAVPAPEE